MKVKEILMKLMDCDPDAEILVSTNFLEDFEEFLREENDSYLDDEEETFGGSGFITPLAMVDDVKTQKALDMHNEGQEVEAVILITKV